MTPKVLSKLKSAVLDKYVKIDIRDRKSVSRIIPKAINVPLQHLSARHIEGKKILLISQNDDNYDKVEAKLEGKLEKSHGLYWLEGGMDGWNGETNLFTPQPFVKTLFDDATGTNQFIVVDDCTRRTLIIDSVLDFCKDSLKVSTRNADSILDYVTKHELIVDAIVETHVHADHLTAAHYIKDMLWKASGKVVPIWIGRNVEQVQRHFGKFFEIEYESAVFDKLLSAGEKFALGELECEIYDTPGHTPDSISIRVGASVFVGDSIFLPDVGSARCDFPGGSAHDLYDSMKQVLFKLPKDTLCFVGHDYPPESERDPQAFVSIEEQLKGNKHINEKTTLDEFVNWRQGRDKTLGNPRLLFFALQVNLRAGRLPGMTMEHPFLQPDYEGFFKVPFTMRK